MLRTILTACALSASLLTAQVGTAQEDITIEDLSAMSQEELTETYLNATSGPIPHGVSEGTARFFPDSVLDYATQQFAYLLWQGKVFDAEDGYLINRVAGMRAVVAKLYQGESLLDGEDSVIIDYSETSVLFNRVRDEIRQVAPTIYLGRAYVRTWVGDFMAVNFILEFEEDQSDDSAEES